MLENVMEKVNEGSFIEVSDLPPLGKVTDYTFVSIIEALLSYSDYIDVYDLAEDALAEAIIAGFEVDHYLHLYGETMVISIAEEVMEQWIK